MPELPEVETMRRGIAPIVGRRIRAVVRLVQAGRSTFFCPSCQRRTSKGQQTGPRHPAPSAGLQS